MSLFSSSDTPAILSDPDTAQVDLGVRFSSSSAGTITGIKFYKGANDTGTHTGTFWTSTGTLLATATFTNETASGWQTVTFSNPVAIDAGTTYVASYHSNGHYALPAITSPLHASMARSRHLPATMASTPTALVICSPQAPMVPPTTGWT